MLTGRLPNGIYYSNRLNEISGGTQKTVKTVSQADLDQLKAEIDQELLALAIDDRARPGAAAGAIDRAPRSTVREPQRQTTAPMSSASKSVTRPNDVSVTANCHLRRHGLRSDAH